MSYGKSFVEFQGAVDEHAEACREFYKVLDQPQILGNLEPYRERLRLSEVKLLTLFNKVLTKVQKAGLDMENE